MISETRVTLGMYPTVVYSRHNIGLLVLGTSNQESVVIRIKPRPYLVDKLAETRSTWSFSDVQEQRFPDFTTNAHLECDQAQSIFRGERRDDKVERSLDDTVLEIRSAGGDVRRGDGEDR